MRCRVEDASGEPHGEAATASMHSASAAARLRGGHDGVPFQRCAVDGGEEAAGVSSGESSTM